MNAEHDPTLLEELRELHHGERAPAELERRIIERLVPSQSRAPLGVRLRAWWSRAPLDWRLLGATVALAAAGALYLAGPALSWRARDIHPEPQLGTAGEERQAARCPLDELPPGSTYDPTRLDPALAHAGLQLETFTMPVPGCPQLVRRALRYVPPGLLAGPLVIVLHDGGDSAEGLRARQAYGGFERLAEGGGFIVVYASAAPAAGHPPSSGVWRSDPSRNQAIDDIEYLARIVERLQARGLLYQPRGVGPDVYLVGYGSGAHLALEAAAQHPERYVAVAAILPDEVNRTRPPPRTADSRLSRLLFVTLQDQRPGAFWAGAPLDATVLDEWGAAIGLPDVTMQRSMNPSRPIAKPIPGPFRAHEEGALIARGLLPAGTRVFDNPNPDHGSPMVRTVVMLSEPRSGGGPPPLDAAALAWEFFQRGVPGYRPPPAAGAP